MTFLEKQATNFLNQWRRIQSFNKTINGKLSKNGAFANVTGYLLAALGKKNLGNQVMNFFEGGDSSNVSCGETGARDAASSAKALQTYNTLKNCSKSVRKHLFYLSKCKHSILIFRSPLPAQCLHQQSRQM